MERRIEDLEDKLNLAQDEIEEHRHKTERLEKTCSDQS
jgi:polyhydroxyalkanoate synthesis regulator phasin